MRNISLLVKYFKLLYTCNCIFCEKKQQLDKIASVMKLWCNEECCNEEIYGGELC